MYMRYLKHLLHISIEIVCGVCFYQCCCCCCRANRCQCSCPETHEFNHYRQKCLLVVMLQVKFIIIHLLFFFTKSVRKRCLNFLVESALRGNDISKQRIDIFLSRYPNSKQIDCALQSVRQQNMRFVHVIHNICWSIDILHDVLVDESAFYSSALIAITRWHDQDCCLDHMRKPLNQENRADN